MDATRIVSKKDGFFDASLYLDNIHELVEEFDADPTQTRTLKSLDLFAGHANFSKECESCGYSSKPIDILHDQVNHDILSEHGFYVILMAILMIDPCSCLK